MEKGSSYTIKNNEVIEGHRKNVKMTSPNNDGSAISKKRREGEWQIGMSSDFQKEIGNFDNNTLGKVLKAIVHLSKTPLQPKGDTIKPLTADLKGLWRYRIGSYRLLYQPDTAHKQIILLSFDNRGDVYRS